MKWIDAAGLSALLAAMLGLASPARAVDYSQFRPDTLWYVDAAEQPPPLVDSTTRWVAKRVNSGQWVYLPERVAAISNFMESAPVGEVDTVSVGGRAWTITKKEAGIWKFVPPWLNPAVQSQAEPGLSGGLVAVVVGALFFGMLFGFFWSAERRALAIKRAKEAIRADLNSKMQQLRTQAQTDAQCARETRGQWELAQAEYAAGWTELKRIEAGLEKTRMKNRELEKQTVEAIRAAENRLRVTPDAATPAARRKWLRLQHLQGAKFGDTGLAVTYVGSADGLFQFRWSVEMDIADPPWVSIIRDGKAVEIQKGFKGDRGDHLRPGKRYMYSFSVQDGRGKTFGNPLAFEIVMPPADVWSGQEAEPETEFKGFMETLKVASTWQEQAVAEVKTWTVDETFKEWAVDQIASFVARLRQRMQT